MMVEMMSGEVISAYSGHARSRSDHRDDEWRSNICLPRARSEP